MAKTTTMISVLVVLYTVKLLILAARDKKLFWRP